MKRLMNCPECNMFVEPAVADITDNPPQSPYQQYSCPNCETIILEEKTVQD